MLGIFLAKDLGLRFLNLSGKSIALRIRADLATFSFQS